MVCSSSLVGKRQSHWASKQLPVFSADTPSVALCHGSEAWLSAARDLGYIADDDAEESQRGLQALRPSLAWHHDRLT